MPSVKLVKCNVLITNALWRVPRTPFGTLLTQLTRLLCLDMFVRANISIPELMLGSCVRLSPRSGKN